MFIIRQANFDEIMFIIRQANFDVYIYMVMTMWLKYIHLLLDLNKNFIMYISVTCMVEKINCKE